MIARYTRPEMGRIWSDENKFRQWLEVELAATEALAETGRGARGSGARCCGARRLSMSARILEIEREVTARRDRVHHRGRRKHGSRRARRASRWLHYGLTSNDVVDTAQALQIRAGFRDPAAGIEALCRRPARRARLRIPTHRADRAHARRARRADHLWAEAGASGTTSAAQPGALRRRGRRLARRQNLGRGGNLRAHRSGSRRAHLRAAGPAARRRSPRR